MVPLAAAATIVLAVAAVFGFGLNNKVQALAFQMTIDHVKCAAFQQLCNGGRPGSGRRAVDGEVRLAAQRAGLFATGRGWNCEPSGAAASPMAASRI